MRFPETTQGLLSLLRDPEDRNYRLGLEGCCRRYWKPVYGYLRVARAKSNEDAKDLTQAFFLWLSEEEALRRYDAGKGSLRAYLKVLLRRFVGHHDRDLARLKRGGGVQTFSLDGPFPVLREPAADSGAADPAQLFDRMWVREVARTAIDRVRDQYRSSGKDLQFRAYEEFALVPEAERPTYRVLAERLGLKESDLGRYIFTVREDIRAEMKAEVSRTAGSDQEFEDDWKQFFGG